jgi:hypothetical protein
MHPARLECPNDLGQVLARERLAAGQQHDGHTHLGKVVGNALDLVERRLPYVGVRVNDVALLACEVAARRHVELHIDRRIRKQGGLGNRPLEKTGENKGFLKKKARIEKLVIRVSALAISLATSG